MVRVSSLTLGHFTGSHRHAFEKTIPAKCIQSHRAKAANRETLSCLCFFVWVNTLRSLPSQPRCKMVRDCSHFWTIRTSSADLKRVGAVHELLRQWLWVQSGISFHVGNTKVWNRSGVPPPRCAMLQQGSWGGEGGSRVGCGKSLPRRRSQSQVQHKTIRRSD